VSRIVVVGGGISGLAIAFRLKRDFGLNAIVLESADRPGGKAQTQAVGDFTCEEATNSWLDKEPAARGLLRDLRISDRIQPADKSAARRFIYRNGTLREVHMHPLKFMTSSLLSVDARFRLAMEPFIKKGRADLDETLADFAARRLGPKARDILIGPMASGIYAGDPSRMSLKSCFAKVFELEQRHGSLIRGMAALKKEKKLTGEDPSTVQAGPSGVITSLKGGVSDLVRALVNDLQEGLRTGQRVEEIRASETGGFSISVDGCEKLFADAVISAAPAWASSSYLRPLDEDAARAFGEIVYPGLDVVCLGFHKTQVACDLDGFGFLVPRNQGMTILGSLWTSSIFPGRAPKDHILIRTMIGGMLEPQVAGWAEEQVMDEVRRDLEGVMGIPRTEEPVVARIFRHEKAIPQYHVGHEKLTCRIRQAESRHRGFFAAGNSIGGIGVIDCIRESTPTAKRVFEFIKSLGL
jgi:oxygen-dependent protoporphyrinogen oxidase